ncbi:MAG: cyclic nucleotide-binding domain-containing protein [Pseudorhodoplanes sp.]|nr:cyclic nucleotide-binding domain-containing protein [Pseudorhodoplanes sp.]
MRADDLALIRKLPLFVEMADTQFEHLTAAALLQRFPPHVLLIKEGEMPDFLHIVVDGSVELFATHEERETTIDIIHPLATFILAAVIRDEVYLKSARTLTDARILMLPAERVREVFGCDAAFARAVVNELAIRYRGMVRALKNEKLRNTAVRLANWILMSDQRQGGAGKVTLMCDKRTLASQLGMTPENLSRNFSLLGKHGIRNHGREIIIEDRTALMAFAQPSLLIDG